MSEQKIKTLFKAAKRKFIEREGANILSGVNERNLCGRLSTYLEIALHENQIIDYYSDTEFNRKQNGEIKTIIDNELKVIKINCDIIVHSRGKFIENDNLLAIEMKKSTRPEGEKISDKNRLRALTKKLGDDVYSNDGITHPEHVCGYQLGVYMEINIQEKLCFFEYYKEGNKVFEWEEKFKF